MKLKLPTLEGIGLFSGSVHRLSWKEEAKPARLVSSSLEAAHGLRHFLRPHSRSAAYAAFMAMVLACILAAATVVSDDHLPLVLGGF